MKFKKPHRDIDIQEIQRDIEDNLADKSDLDMKYTKVTDISKSIPQVTDLNNGETKMFHDGTNYYRYYKVGGNLLRQQLTEV